MGRRKAPLCARKQKTMEIKRPNHERFNMSQDELYAFWIIIFREYRHRSVREKSLLLYNNRLIRSEDAG